LLVLKEKKKIVDVIIKMTVIVNKVCCLLNNAQNTIFNFYMKYIFSKNEIKSQP